jgi:cytochrome c oxidase cbb3-type subunit 3
VVVLAALLSVACQPDPRSGVAVADPIEQAQTANETVNVESGRKIYNFRCYFCHGYSGNARTLAATYLDPKPRDFTEADVKELDRAHMIETIRDGHAGTAMAGFRGILTPGEIEQVADFVRDEFMLRKAVNTRYHTAANGWPKHERYRDAYAFATGEIGLDTPWEELSPQQAAGKRLYLASCVSCHDRGRAGEDGVSWELRAVSYPPNEDSCLTCHGADGRIKPSAKQMLSKVPEPDATVAPHARRPKHADATNPYAMHDVVPRIAGLSADERKGEQLYQKNCAFCHAADGTGRNWIGAFLQPHPRDLTDPRAMVKMTRERLYATIREGVPGTSMPAWKSVLEEQDIEMLAAYISRAFYPIPAK